MANKKTAVLTRQLIGFIIVIFGGGIATLTPYTGAGGIIIAIGLAIASGLK